MTFGRPPLGAIAIRGLLTTTLCALWILTPNAQPIERLTPKQIAQAVQWGTDGTPAPYQLHHRSPDPAKSNPVVLGAVYTPFLRVALAANAARNAGRTFTAEDVPQSLIEPVVYVALRWYCCDVDHGTELPGYHPLQPFDYKIAVPGQDRFTVSYMRLDKVNLERPLWTSRDLTVLTKFGADVPYGDVVLVAAYPVSALTADTDFIIYRDTNQDDQPARHLRDGRATAQELAEWR